MAGDWIPVRLDLPDDPAVIRMAEILSIDVDTVVGKLIRLWGWASRHLVSGHSSLQFPFVDRMVGVEGFAAAMEKAGWLQIEPDGITFPNWDHWLSNSAKARLGETLRKRLTRAKDKPQSGTAPGPMSGHSWDKTVTTGEESTGEKKKEPPPPLRVTGAGEGQPGRGAGAAAGGERAGEMGEIEAALRAAGASNPGAIRKALEGVRRRKEPLGQTLDWIEFHRQKGRSAGWIVKSLDSDERYPITEAESLQLTRIRIEREDRRQA